VRFIERFNADCFPFCQIHLQDEEAFRVRLSREHRLLIGAAA
jgi:hypothetical protein